MQPWNPIVDGLLNNPTLQLLKFNNCQFVTENEGRAIPALEWLLEFSDVKILELNLNASIISSLQMDDILSLMYENSLIRRLNLSSCRLVSTVTLTILQTLLHHNTCLEHLNISFNALNSIGQCPCWQWESIICRHLNVLDAVSMMMPFTLCSHPSLLRKSLKKKRNHHCHKLLTHNHTNEANFKI